MNEREEYSAKLKALLVDFVRDLGESSRRLESFTAEPVEYRFGPYTLRMATEADRDTVAAWIAADAFHKDQVDADFFLREEPGVGCYLLLDYAGPLFFFRTDNTVRVHIQFNGATAGQDRERNREALQLGMDWLAAQLASRSITEITFDSVNPILRRMTEKRLSFVAAPDDLRRSLGPERAAQASRKKLRDAPHNLEEGAR